MDAEFRNALAIRSCIEMDGVDIHNGDSLFNYAAELQSISGSGAELIATMRKALEDERVKVMDELMSEEEGKFWKMSMTLQNKYIEAKMSTHIASYQYCEYLNKRISYSMDMVRSMLSYIKQDMMNERFAPRQS